ncbi:PREDICTED: uncharacterized protein LOC109161398 [Ipomoea nil]|uniref:uncharacterized protein LOC109161398 n=1 Tax=Ipomoea nil TaxID=35883 RepID=UPI00090145C9|nr:PREDICTED: uncharacterized protein LOC109161398 [Ipomoea nil]
MATAHFLSCCTHSQSGNLMSLKLNSPYAGVSKGLPSVVKNRGYILNLRPYKASIAAKPRIFRVMSMAAGQSDESRSLNLDNIVKKARELWDSSPQPVKIFPWNSVLDNFVQLIFDLALAVFKCLYVPVLIVSSASELSYCAHERKSYLIPFPFIVGASIAGILNSAALESSLTLKHAEVPWHLIAIAILFTLLKLPGPYYPYWGRILIPHFANGALYRTMWFLFLWYRRPRKSSEEVIPESVPTPSE